MFAWFERVVGLERLSGFHLNDSKTPLGSRIDRHEHIGKGHLGVETFRRLLNDPRFAALPMLIETAKTEHGSRVQVGLDSFDVMNLATLRGLVDHATLPQVQCPGAEKRGGRQGRRPDDGAADAGNQDQPRCCIRNQARRAQREAPRSPNTRASNR